MLWGLSQLNLELTNRCDKRTLCGFCGHQDASVNPMVYGDMAHALLVSLRDQLSPGPVISFHRDGDPLAAPQLRLALDLFLPFVTSLVTHGLSLAQRWGDLEDRCTTVTVSLFRADPDRDLQLSALRDVVSLRKSRAPRLQLKVVGDMSEEELAPYRELNWPILRRLIHVPTGNAHYAHRLPTIPEVGMCLDALHRPTIDWRGRMYLCNRLDPAGHLYIGDAASEPLEAIWNGQRRAAMVLAHKYGRRDKANETCAKCQFWGIPSQWEPVRELPMVNI